MKIQKKVALPIGGAVTAVVLAACGGGHVEVLNVLPAGVTNVSKTSYSATTPADGTSAAKQDLLTGGLGKTGLLGATPAYADPLNPTAAELRRNALYANYRALVDYTPNGGFGRLFGPNIDLTGADSLGEGLVAGVEYLGYVDDGTGKKTVVMAVQVPAKFDPANPCIVVGPSSGSRGVYGAIASAGDWGLKRGCAVALTDSGKGMGLYDPTDDTVNKLDGTRATRAAAGAMSHFAATITDAARATFNAAFPNRLALKHMHSQMNPEKDWGNDTLTAVRYALFVINEEYAPSVSGGGGKQVKFDAKNTLVIAGSVSNGGSAVLRAAELDSSGLIGGVVAGEPNAQPNSTDGYTVQVGGITASKFGRPAMDYFTYANLYQPCAALAPAATLAELTVFNYMTIAGMNGRGANRCAALAAKGLVTGADTAAQATDALNKLHGYGFTTPNDTMHNAHYALGNAVIISTMYSTAYARAGLADNLCGTSLAQVNGTGDPIAILAASKASSYAVGNGTANGSPATVVYNNSVGGAKAWTLAVSPSSGTADFALDAALCQRALYTGVDTVSGAALTAASTPTKAQSDAVRAGVAEVLLSGNLRGKPTLIVGGRSDNLIPVNHSERAYVAFNGKVEGAASKLRYIEVTNAQHFDSFVPFSGFDTRYVPLHYYFVQAMNAMYANLKSGTALPPSQVVRTTVRGGTPGAAPAITTANVPSISTAPAAADQITVSSTLINVPN